MKEITGIFDKKNDLDSACEELSKIGIKKSDISLLAREKDVHAKLGKDYKSVYELKAGDDIPRIEYISEKTFFNRENIFITILFYLGLITALGISVIKQDSISLDIAIAFFAGMFLQLIAIFISSIFRKRHSDYIERKLNKGGFLFWIKLSGKKNLRSKIYKILKKYSAHKVRFI